MSPVVRAQRTFGGRPGFGVSHGGGFGHFGGRCHFASAVYLPYFYPDYYDYRPDVVEAPPPQTIVLQTPQPAPQASATTAPAEPLVIELRGNRWVRITGDGEAQAGEEWVRPETAPARDAKQSDKPSTLPPAVLVFRDGHQEEIGKYVITGSTIYVRADYWTSGSWTRKVEIADLDVPATLMVNLQMGTQFRLPSSPNEVMMRP